MMNRAYLIVVALTLASLAGCTFDRAPGASRVDGGSLRRETSSESSTIYPDPAPAYEREIIIRRVPSITPPTVPGGIAPVEPEHGISQPRSSASWGSMLEPVYLVTEPMSPTDTAAIVQSAPSDAELTVRERTHYPPAKPGNLARQSSTVDAKGATATGDKVAGTSGPVTDKGIGASSWDLEAIVPEADYRWILVLVFALAAVWLFVSKQWVVAGLCVGVAILGTFSQSAMMLIMLPIVLGGAGYVAWINRKAIASRAKLAEQKLGIEELVAAIDAAKKAGVGAGTDHPVLRAELSEATEQMVRVARGNNYTDDTSKP